MANAAVRLRFYSYLHIFTYVSYLILNSLEYQVSARRAYLNCTKGLTIRPAQFFVHSSTTLLLHHTSIQKYCSEQLLFIRQELNTTRSLLIQPGKGVGVLLTPLPIRTDVCSVLLPSQKACGLDGASYHFLPYNN